MTDNTQPEAGSTYIIRLALELGLLWIDGDGRDKVREALDALDTLKSQLASIVAGGVQAGAVPQGWKAVPVNPTPEMWKAAKSVPDPNPPYPPHYGLVWDAMLAASPTPPAEQATPPTAQAEGWRLVPVEPTHKMRFAAMNAFAAASASLGAYNAPDAAYRALLAAAPTHPTSSVVVEHG